MLKIGITGGIGSGKTLICKLFEMQNIPVFYADLQAKVLMETDLQLIDEIKTVFGIDAYLPNGALNRTKLASIVFNDSTKLNTLNSLVHPAVFNAFAVWAERQNSPYVLKEAALLFESGSYKDCDRIIMVKSPLDLRISRIIKRDSITEEAVIKRINKQLSDEEKEKRSDFIIINDEQQLIIPQVLKLHHFFLDLSNG